jgi:hypothetical protein
MRAYYQGKTYLVEFSDSDTQCFARHTGADSRSVHGSGAFIFDTGTGDLLGARGTAAEHAGDVQWLAFSQDAQEHGRGQLAREGVVVNPFDFGPYMPELAVNPAKGNSAVGRRVELVHTPDQWTTLRPGALGTVTHVDDAGTVFVAWDEGPRLGLVPGVDHFQYVQKSNPGKAEHARVAVALLDEGKRLLQLAHPYKREWEDSKNHAAHREACGLARAAYANVWMAESQILHVPGDLEATAGTLRDNVVKVLNELRCPWSDILYDENPVSRISRTRGVKTMRGPYDARKGYQPWITRRGKLGTGFLTSMSVSERHKSLDRCVREYGYRSCLGSIMALERARRGPRGTGEGVGVKYAKELAESHEYLKKKYGGVGSAGRKKKDRRISVAADAGLGYMATNPGQACVWKTVEADGVRTPILVWTGGIPTAQEILDAPNFTIFPSPNKVRGKLPYGEDVQLGNGVTEPAWFVTERDPPYDEAVERILNVAFDLGGGSLSTIFNTNDDLRGETHDWGRGPVKIEGDDQAWPWAIERGFTLIKVPDALRGKDAQYAEVFALDSERRRGDTYWWEQTPERVNLLRGQTQSNPCFGLHVHGDQVVPTLEHLFGQPSARAHAGNPKPKKAAKKGAAKKGAAKKKKSKGPSKTVAKRKVRIGAEVHSDDYHATADFDATPWFEQATDRQISDLADAGWRGDYPADVIAEWIHESSLDAGVDAVFDYIATADLPKDYSGFEVSVDEDQARRWVAINRPELEESL